MWSNLLVLVLAQDGWWNPDWSHRRSLMVTDTVRGSHAEGLAVAEIPTLGRLNPDGSDVRVIDREGHEVRSQLRSCGFEDRALIVFEASYRGAYTLYFGNPKAKASFESTSFLAGLTLEVRELGEGNPRTWAGMQQLLQNSPKVLGRWACPTISLGFNPLGPWEHGIFIFSGFIRCPADGEYAFATNSIDASFLFIDGMLVTEWPGWHGPQGGEQGGHQSRVKLEEGVHRIEYVNAFRGHGACVVGWQRPGDKRMSPLSPEAFEGLLVARSGPAETREGPVADFEWSFEDDLGYEGRQVTAVRFHALMAGKHFTWSFGDGVTSTEASPLHVYLNSGEFTATLEVDGKSATQRLQVRPMRGHLGKAYERRLQVYSERIFNYPTDGLAPEACFEMGLICHEARRYDSAARGFRVALEKGYKPRDGEEARWVLRLFELYRENGRYDDALWVCDHILANKPPDPAAVMALNLKAEILYDYQNKPDAAEACCKTILEKYGKAPTDYVRAAYIRLGELAMVQGRRDEAKKILADAQSADRWRKWNGDFEITEGAHSINFEEYMRQNEFEGAWREIQGLVWEQPLTLLSGSAREMKGRVFLATKKFELALKEFDRAMAADPKASFADEALLWMGQCYEALKQQDKAKECFQKIVNEFPESTLIPRAKEKLK